MVDLVNLLSTLVDSKGKILIPGIYDSVAKCTEEEKKIYEPIDFCTVNKRFNKNLHFFRSINI